MKSFKYCYSKHVIDRIHITCHYIILFLFILASSAFADDDISYDFEFSGLESQEHENIEQIFEEASILIREKSEQIFSISDLRNNLEADRKVIEQILRAEGYYNSETSSALVRQNNHFKITLNIIPGPQYTYGKVEILFENNVPDNEIQNKIASNLTIKEGEQARAEPVITSEAGILNSLPKFGYPFVDGVKREFIVDHKLRVLNVTFKVDTGIRRKIGIVELKGLNTVDERYVRKFITWPQDSYYEQHYINELRNRIIKSNLFAGVTVDITPGAGDLANITVNHTEAKHRTIGTSAGYSTAEGFGGEVSWEHRNFTGDGKRLKITARTSEIEQSLASRLEVPHFKRLDQTLSFEGVARRQDTDAFFAHVLETRAGIDRVITTNLALLANIDLEYSDVTDTLGDRDFFLISLPFGVRWDSSDNLLDPNRGLRASLITAPSYGIGETSFEFLKSEFRASAYFPLMASDKLIFAARTRIGSIIGVDTNTLPAIRRFFSGGGGSIRGYAFQRVGPLGSDDNPFGGRSVNEFATELRWKFENNLGMVLFAEGGNVYNETTPQFKDFRYAAGVGARYATGFGPVRFDVAFPLNKRPGDSSFQIYISLGQAF